MTSPAPRQSSPFACVLEAKASLGECPVWSCDERVPYWVDINAPSLNRLDPATGTNVSMPMPESIGCVAFRADGGFVVALGGGTWLARQPQSGGIFAMRVDVAGLPEPKFAG